MLVLFASRYLTALFLHFILIVNTILICRFVKSFTSVPMLDLAQGRHRETKPAFLRQLRHALLEVGFLYLRNVGIPEYEFHDIVKQGIAFFDIPEEEK